MDGLIDWLILIDFSLNDWLIHSLILSLIHFSLINLLIDWLIEQVVSESLASILLNSSNLLRIDLDGVNVLAPSIVSALEAVLPEKEVINLIFPLIIREK